MPRHKRQYWLVKTEPDVFSIDDLQRLGRSMWEGVRNFQARNYMRDQMHLGDPVLIYHSNAKPPGIVGLGEVVRESYPDHTSWDPAHKYFDPASSPDNPRWFMVDIGYVETFPRMVSLHEVQKIRRLASMPLVNRSRLSVQPVKKTEFDRLVKLAHEL
jgi:predicted RNA-binding protein with PUA-like domain